MSGKRSAIVSIYVVGALALCCAFAAPALGALSHGYAWGGLAIDLGDGTLTESELPVQVAGLTEVTQIAGGERHALALSAEGTVTAWGENTHGQLGDGGTESSDVPVPVSGLSEVTALAASGEHSLALLGDGTVEAWGNNEFGALGDGGTESSDVPVPVHGLSGVTAIATGGAHGLALLGDGTVMAWGQNADGELGDGSTETSDVPVPVSGLSEVVAIAAGKSFSLALLRDGEVRSWGLDKTGELGDGGHCACKLSTVPTTVDISEVATIAAGFDHAAALLDDGTVEAWGEGEQGELGDGLRVNTSTPQVVSPLGEVAALAAGGDHSMALLDDGNVMSWGDGATRPIPVPCGIEGVVGIDTGTFTRYAWGQLVDTCPKVTALSTEKGSESAETPVTITGTNFTGASSVTFAGLNASSFTVESPTVIQAMAPPGSGAGPVVVTNPKGESTPFGRFSYERPPEFGRCLSGEGIPDDFATDSCVSVAPIFNPDDWFPAFEPSMPLKRRDFKVGAVTAFKLETAHKTQINCEAATGAGEYTGNRTVTIGTLTLTGCAEKGAGSCQSEGAKAGEVSLVALDAQLGEFKDKTTQRAGIKLSPASGELLAQFTCAAAQVTVKGAVILEAKSDKMSLTNTWKATQSKHVQEPTSFEGSPEATLSVKLGASAAYEAAALKAKLTQTNEEKIEVDNSTAIE